MFIPRLELVEQYFAMIYTSISWAVKLSWLENATYSLPLFSAGDFDYKLGQTEILVCDQGSLVGLCVVHAILQVSVCTGV